MTEVLSYKNQSIDLQKKSVDWFQCDREDLCHERDMQRSIKYLWWNRWNLKAKMFKRLLAHIIFPKMLRRR